MKETLKQLRKRQSLICRKERDDKYQEGKKDIIKLNQNVSS